MPSEQWTEDENEDATEFNDEAQILRGNIVAFLEQFYGEKCQEHERGCIICQKYQQMEQLLESPFDDY